VNRFSLDARQEFKAANLSFSLDGLEAVPFRKSARANHQRSLTEFMANVDLIFRNFGDGTHAMCS
jgi:hypothetical protein